jgi:hypothetical protein
MHELEKFMEAARALRAVVDRQFDDPATFTQTWLDDLFDARTRFVAAEEALKRPTA